MADDACTSGDLESFQGEMVKRSLDLWSITPIYCCRSGYGDVIGKTLGLLSAGTRNVTAWENSGVNV